MSAASVSLELAREAGGEWVVCLGATHDADDGQVACPAGLEPVALARCLVCHHLVDASDDRGRVTCALADQEVGCW
jgi:hypothetical protein